MLVEVIRPRPGEGAANPGTAPREDVYALRTHLIALRESLRVAARPPRRSRWCEPAVFFFDPARQAELRAARLEAPNSFGPNDSGGAFANSPPRKQGSEPLPLLAPRALRPHFAEFISRLQQSAELRCIARAVPGLLEAARAVPAARDLAELLQIPDDEAILVLHPARRQGYRLGLRGVVTVHQFQVLLLQALAQADEWPEHRLPARFANACSEAEPIIPAGVPMLLELPFQCYRPAAVERDGSLPQAFAGCSNWLWGWEPLAAAPRLPDGQRIILLGEPAFPQVWEVERRFPLMEAEVELLEVLSPFQVADRLGALAGGPVPVHPRPVRREVLAVAA
jgi:hypothetical protein